MVCQKCGAKHGCGCQKRTASDGTVGCSRCIPTYELQLQQSKKKMTDVPEEQEPAVIPDGGVKIEILSIEYNKG
jgi:hypothetical protein